MKLDLPLVKLEFTFKANQDIYLPKYAGSALRGVFGSSLRRICCLSGKPTCTDCALKKTCPYASIFESQEGLIGRSVNPYIIEPNLEQTRKILKDEEFSFTQIFFGDCIKSLSFILLAWTKGMKRGISKEKATADLVKVIQKHPDGDRFIYDISEAELQTPIEIFPLKVPENRNEITIHIETPLRIHKDKHPLKPEEVMPGDIVSSLIRRIELLYTGHTSMESFVTDKKTLLEKAKSLNVLKKDFKWQDWTRWSGRQQKHIS
ncbi:MAG: hypothetical protein IJC30_02045, partial [Alphaproteobacteria bacterium]|nr:hypothetical protein [Alphaproteobacteria bacterium]